MEKRIKYLAVIPARKNSKRIINKNLIKINKKELIKFTIEAARKTKKIQEIILTSDDAKILNIAKKSKIIAFKRKNTYFVKYLQSLHLNITYLYKYMSRFFSFY